MLSYFKWATLLLTTDHIQESFGLRQKEAQLKRKICEVINQPSDENTTILQDIIRAEVCADVHAAIQSLPPQCQKFMQLEFFEEIRVEEIAKELGVNWTERT